MLSPDWISATPMLLRYAYPYVCILHFPHMTNGYFFFPCVFAIAPYIPIGIGVIDAPLTVTTVYALDVSFPLTAPVCRTVSGSAYVLVPAPTCFYFVDCNQRATRCFHYANFIISHVKFSGGLRAGACSPFIHLLCHHLLYLFHINHIVSIHHLKLPVTPVTNSIHRCSVEHHMVGFA